jgi:hypothetical protein
VDRFMNRKKKVGQNSLAQVWQKDDENAEKEF